MNNAVYGKTMENLRNRCDVRDPKRGKRLASRPNFEWFKLINDNLTIIKFTRTSVTLDKPCYVGLCILELSKLHMYKFHYDVI